MASIVFYLSEIRLFSCSFAPKGWALCNGQLLPINQNQALFSLLGIRYGGNGVTSFGLPDLRGRVPIHVGSGHTLAELGGQQAHTLSVSETPQHLHRLNASTTQATTGTPSPAMELSTSAGAFAYGPPQSLVPMDPTAIANVGGSQAHPNMQPYLTLSFCIALQGLFPSVS